MVIFNLEKQMKKDIQDLSVEEMIARIPKEYVRLMEENASIRRHIVDLKFQIKENEKAMDLIAKNRKKNRE
jgi:hypothetical protein